MNVTTIQALKSAIKDVDTLCAEIIKQNSRDTLFPSANAYKHIKEDLAPTCPQDYFYLRIMQYYVELGFSSLYHRYFLYFEHFIPSYKFDYEKIRGEKNYFLLPDTDFDSAQLEFQRAAADMIHRSFGTSNDLFYTL